MMKNLLVMTLCFALFSFAADAQQKSGKKRQPPKEAIAACENKTEGDSVSFTTPKGDNLTAQCKLIGNTLIAVPEDHEKRSANRVRI